MLVVLGGALWWQQQQRTSVPELPAAELDPSLQVVDTPAYTIETVTIDPPSLDREVSITADLPEDAAAMVRTTIESLKQQLTAEPTRIDLWLKLGVYYKLAGDYEGAIEAWDYVAAGGQSSISYIGYANQGDLYMNFIKDYAKAETNYKAAISINPRIVEYYRNLFFLYRDIRGNPGAAAAIVEQGLAANPDHPDLLSLKSQL